MNGEIWVQVVGKHSWGHGRHWQPCFAHLYRPNTQASSWRLLTVLLCIGQVSSRPSDTLYLASEIDSDLLLEIAVGIGLLPPVQIYPIYCLSGFFYSLYIRMVKGICRLFSNRMLLSTPSSSVLIVTRANSTARQ